MPQFNISSDLQAEDYLRQVLDCFIMIYLMMIFNNKIDKIFRNPKSLNMMQSLDGS